MGCWHETCFLSHLPILSGEKVKVLFLKKVPSSINNNTGVCYPDTLYSPICYPITAEYDDYGGIENVELDPISLLNLDLLKVKYSGSLAKEAGVRPDRIWDEKSPRPLISDWGWSDLWRSIEREVGILVQDDDESFFGEDLIGIMIRADVWDLTVRIKSSSNYGWEDEIYQVFLETTWSSLMEKISNQQLTQVGNVFTGFQNVNFDSPFTQWSSILPLHRFLRRDLVSGYIEQLGDISQFRAEKLDYLLHDNTFSIIDFHKKSFFEFMSISSFLVDTRRVWGPGGSGKGGQTTNWDLYQKVYSEYSTLCQKMHADESEES